MVRMGPKHGFQFDAVFDDAPQAEVYESTVAPLLDGVFAGYNATVLAYGQTGSGKTFTMGSADQVGIPMAKCVRVWVCVRARLQWSGVAATRSHVLFRCRQGVIPRVVREVFDRVDGAEPVTLPSGVQVPSVAVRASFVELYREEIRDLLHPETPSRAIAIRETPAGEIVLSGVGEKAALTAQDMFGILETGAALRSTGATLMNELSSRSHAVFTIVVEQRRADGKRTVAKLHLVDLAGSERAKRSGAAGVRLKEAVNINEGLLALGNVISALAARSAARSKSRGRGKSRQQHVPYRDSKLTRLLQDSLGGNSRTVMIACVSPADVSFEETLNTLRYAARARNIKNTPVQNVQTADSAAGAAAMTELQAEIDALQSALASARADAAGGGAGVVAPAPPDPIHVKQLHDLQGELDKAVRTGTAYRTQLVRASEALVSVVAATTDTSPHMKVRVW